MLRFAALAAVMLPLTLAGCSGEVEFRLNVPAEVRLAPDGAASFPVAGTLANETGRTVKLEASTVCLAEDWRIFEPDGTVAAKPVEVVCIQMLGARDLTAGETLTLRHQVEVPPGRLGPGRAYRLVFEFWRTREEAEFATVLGAPG